MAFRKVTTNFEATQIDLNDEEDITCSQLEGGDISGDIPFSVGSPTLNDTFYKQKQIVNGVDVVQFERGGLSYCVKRSVYDESTEIIDGPLIGTTTKMY